ncbi:protein FAR1-RELATED SEQUENCE 9-like [Rhododendron vialii]|uniref:protein FAR1-RELATED SEQUENCE 9-like n=1 Tax=Rhododendron vialii TaxID=182163 RepID=UPI00265DDEC9|nr:protein FAR1-RELATED SEQUENCE 9-like [Rhododendron vialii]
MTSNQRVEISHSFFKRYVSKENSMIDFVMRFNRALAKVRHNELDLDHKDVNEKPQLKTSWAMEKGMSEIYTWSIFERFQEEIFQINAYVVTFIRENEHRCLWNVQREEMEGARIHEISVDKSSNRVSCSCKMFEFDGIPCRHLLAYLFRMQIRELPTEYILQRWMKTAKAGRVMDDLGSDEVGDGQIPTRDSSQPFLAFGEFVESTHAVNHGSLRTECEYLDGFRLTECFDPAIVFGYPPSSSLVIDEAVLDEEESEVVREALESSQKKIALMRSARKDGSPSSIQLASTSRIQVPSSLGSQHSLKEPLQVRAKGCGKRLK